MLPLIGPVAVCYVGPVITVVLDDDPTGTQAITNVSVVLDWSDPDVVECDGLAVVATERRRNPGLVAADAQRRIAVALAQVARRVPCGVVAAKGGITSAVTAREGLGARSARVVGPILPGVALWHLPDGTQYVIVPGNVGGPELLAEVVAAIGPVPVPVGEAQC